jgi:hypothetical protein
MVDALVAVGRSGIVVGGRLYSRGCTRVMVRCEIYPAGISVVELTDIEGLGSAVESEGAA